MRIGIDASRAFLDQRTGTENYSYQIIKHLLALPEVSSHEFILYVRSNFQFSIFKFQSIFQIPNFKFQIIPLRYCWTQIGLATRTWIDNLDVLWIPAHTLPVLRKPSLKTVVTIHGIEYEFLPQYENWLQRWYLPLSTKYAISSANKIIAVSEFTKSQIIEKLGGDPKKITVVYEGTTPNFQFTSTNLQIILKKYNLQKQKYILFIGTIQPRKNLKRLIEAFKKLENYLKIKNCKLVIAGKLGWNYADLPIDKYPNIIFTRYVDDKTRNILLHNALAYVQPSITEGFGLPVLEAMNAGVPVVSSSGGALAEIVGEAGVLFDPFDGDDISHKLSLVINSHSLRKQLIKKGYNRVKKFTWNQAAVQSYNILTN